MMALERLSPLERAAFLLQPFRRTVSKVSHQRRPDIIEPRFICGGRHCAGREARVLGLREVDRWFIDEVLPFEARYLAVARRFGARGAAGGDEAADLVHDVYARVLASEGWRFIDDPRAYVLTMIRNLGIQKIRRARIVVMETLASAEGALSDSESPDAFDETSGRQRLRLAFDALRALPPRCREVVELRRLHDLSSRDIARRLGLSLSTVEKRLARGMVLMAQAMIQADRPVEPAIRSAARSAPGEAGPRRVKK
jgi:RNA polymerase sigma-70 factor (ECF subfamily)